MAIAVENSANVSDVTDSTSTSGSYTCTGSDLTLVALIHYKDITTDTRSVSTLTYNSVSLTFQGRVVETNATNVYAGTEIWTLDDPATGSNTLAVTMDGSCQSLTLNAVSLSGSQGIGGVATNSGNSADVTVTVTTSSTSNIVVAGVTSQTSSATPYTPGTGSTELLDSFNSTISYWVAHETAGASSTTVDATASANRRFAAIGVEVQEAGGDVPRRIFVTQA